MPCYATLYYSITYCNILYYSDNTNTTKTTTNTSNNAHTNHTNNNNICRPQTSLACSSFFLMARSARGVLYYTISYYTILYYIILYYTLITLIYSNLL